MVSSSIKKSLAASAVLATSVAAAAGLTQSAQAAPAGPAGAMLTSSDGTQKIQLNLTTGAYAMAPTAATDVAWAPGGGRYAYVDSQGQILTATADTWATLRTVVPAAAGVTRSHPTWAANGTTIIYTETDTATNASTLKAVAAYTDPSQTPTPTDALSMLGGPVLTPGTESAPDGNGGSDLVFQHVNAAHVAEVWIQDGFGRASAGPKFVADGTSPSLSPDGTKIVYDALVSGNQQLFVVGWDRTNQKTVGTPTAITADAHDHLRPTWSPDGTRIAYENASPGGGTAIDVQSVDAAGANQKQEFANPGVPAYAPIVKDKAYRLAGYDRLGTAITVSQTAWAAGSAQAVVLSRSDKFADALGGAQLANVKQGPLLLTPTSYLDTNVKTEIQRVLGPVNAATPQTVYVLGGAQALSPAVYDAVAALGYQVKRIEGPERYSTSVAIAQEITGPNTPGRVLVATGNLFPDALSAGAAAGASAGNGPMFGVVVLTNDTTMPASTGAYLASVESGANKPAVYGVGGQADKALTNAGIAHTGLVGTDRYMTSYMVARTFFNGSGIGEGTPPTTVGIATGGDWPDALSGGAFMAGKGGPLLLVNPVSWSSPDMAHWLNGWSASIDSVYAFGGPNAVNDFTFSEAANEAGAGSGYTFLPAPHA